MALPYNFINNRGYGIREGRVALCFACEKSIIVWSFFKNFYSLLIFLLTDGVYILALFPPPGGGGIFSRWGSFRGRLSEINKEEEEKTPKKTGKVFKKNVWGKGGGFKIFKEYTPLFDSKCSDMEKLSFIKCFYLYFFLMYKVMLFF